MVSGCSVLFPACLTALLVVNEFLPGQSIALLHCTDEVPQVWVWSIQQLVEAIVKPLTGVVGAWKAHLQSPHNIPQCYGKPGCHALLILPTTSQLANVILEEVLHELIREQLIFTQLLKAIYDILHWNVGQC